MLQLVNSFTDSTGRSDFSPGIAPGQDARVYVQVYIKGWSGAQGRNGRRGVN